jgi:biotin carboxyl carrier protein
VVVKVLVAVGDAVTRGQPLVVVSAMKMETTLVAPKDGTVSEIKAKEGDKVNPSDVLVHIEEKSE